MQSRRRRRIARAAWHMLRFTLRIYDTIFRAFRVCILMELEVYLPTLLLLLWSLWMNILLVLF